MKKDEAHLSLIAKRGGEMDSLLQSGQRLGVFNRSLFLKRKPHRLHPAGSRTKRPRCSDRAMC